MVSADHSSERAKTYLKNDELQLGDIIRMNPVFSRLANEVLLCTTGGRVSFNWVSFGANQIVKLGQLHHERIIIIFEERLGFESCGKNWLEMPACFFLSGKVSLKSVCTDAGANTTGKKKK